MIVGRGGRATSSPPHPHPPTTRACHTHTHPTRPLQRHLQSRHATGSSRPRRPGTPAARWRGAAGGRLAVGAAKHLPKKGEETRQQQQEGALTQQRPSVAGGAARPATEAAGGAGEDGARAAWGRAAWGRAAWGREASGTGACPLAAAGGGSEAATSETSRASAGWRRPSAAGGRGQGTPCWLASCTRCSFHQTGGRSGR